MVESFQREGGKRQAGKKALKKSKKRGVFDSPASAIFGVAQAVVEPFEAHEPPGWNVRGGSLMVTGDLCLLQNRGRCCGRKPLRQLVARWIMKTFESKTP